MVKSRARMVLEKFNMKEDDTTIPPATGTSDVGDPANAAPTSDKGATEDPNQPHDPKVGEWLEDVAGQPDGMAGVIDGAADMMDRYTNEDDQAVFTPDSEEDKAAVGEAKGYLKQASRCLRGMKRG